MKGFCKVNVKFMPRRRATILANMERYRPLTAHDQKMHKLRTEPRMYEYLPLPGLTREIQAQQEEPGMGLLLLAFLKSFGMPTGEGFGSEGGQK